jgi:Fe2+ or Zn2+ uptake regulation protein
MAATTTEVVLARLREAGGRVTTTRRLVVRALIEADSHLTADDLAAVVRAAHPEVHLSTVYRTLETLEALGFVEHTHVGHSPAVYHVGDAHQHLVCEQCGAIFDLDASRVEPLREELRERFGFELHVGHFALLGRCRRCAASARRSG